LGTRRKHIPPYATAQDAEVCIIAENSTGQHFSRKKGTRTCSTQISGVNGTTLEKQKQIWGEKVVA
jgi:hypothetical protein